MNRRDVELHRALDTATSFSEQPDDGAPADQWDEWMELQGAATTIAGCVQTVTSGGHLDRDAVADAGHVIDALPRTGRLSDEVEAWGRVLDLLRSTGQRTF